MLKSREVMVLITGANKSIALYKAIEEGVCHMWTVSAFQQHPNTLMVCDEVWPFKELPMNGGLV